MMIPIHPTLDVLRAPLHRTHRLDRPITGLPLARHGLALGLEW